jgi:hypothetical protein
VNVVYVPWGQGVDEMITYGAAWLNRQRGAKLVLLPAKSIYERNPLLPRLTAGAEVAAPTTLSRSTWRGGPVLAPWPNERVLTEIADRLGDRATDVCVLPWNDDQYTNAWLAAYRAVNLLDGQAQTPDADLQHPVVAVAMEQLARLSRHNGLDRDRAVGTLIALVRAGYSFDVDALVAQALAYGFAGRDVEKLRDYATKALAGHQFRIRGLGGLRPDIVSVWEREARERGLDVTKPDVGPDPAPPDAVRPQSRDW